jgi:hypothetical protein
MGVDLNLRFPGNVQARYVADVFGKLVGCESSMEPLQAGHWPGEPTPRCCAVKGVELEACQPVPVCCFFNIRPPGGRDAWKVMYHFEFGCDQEDDRWCFEGQRGIILRSTRKNLAIARRLVMFYGGSLIYSDHADNDFHEAIQESPFDSKVYCIRNSEGEEVGVWFAAKPDSLNCPHDGQPWQDLQDRVHAVVEVTQDDIESEAEYASYEG